MVRYRFAVVILVRDTATTLDVVFRKGFNPGNWVLNRKNLRLSSWVPPLLPCYHQTHSNSDTRCAGVFPHQAILCDISSVCDSLTQFWRYRPGDRVRSHRLRLSPTTLPRPPPPSKCQLQIQVVICASDGWGYKLHVPIDSLFMFD